MKRISTFLIYLLVVFPLLGIPKTVKADVVDCPGPGIFRAEIIDNEATDDSNKYLASPMIFISKTNLGGLWSGMDFSASNATGPIESAQYIGVSGDKLVFSGLGNTKMVYFFQDQDIYAGQVSYNYKKKESNFGYVLTISKSSLKNYTSGSELKAIYYLKIVNSGSSANQYGDPNQSDYDKNPLNDNTATSLRGRSCGVKFLNSTIPTQLKESFFRDKSVNTDGPALDADVTDIINSTSESVDQTNTDRIDRGVCNVDKNNNILFWGVCIVEDFFINTMIWILEKVTGVTV